MMTLTKEDLAAIEGLFTGKFDGIDRQFESIDKRFESIDKRFDAMDERLDGMDRRFDAMDERLDSLEHKVDNIDCRLEHVESDVSSLKIGQLNLSRELKKLSTRVDETYRLALENWGQIQESKGRIAILES